MRPELSDVKVAQRWPDDRPYFLLRTQKKDRGCRSRIKTIMASGNSQAFAPVLAAMATMQGNVSREQKQQANEFLEAFQKSVRLPMTFTWIVGGVYQIKDNAPTKDG